MSASVTDPTDDRLVIALDFGTTFSGVAYAFNAPGKKADAVAIQEWPGLEGYRQPKVPTLILYDESDPSKFSWGGQINWRDPAVHGVKLLLDPSQEKPSYLRGSDTQLDRDALPKEPVDVAADFIGAMYTHALSIIESSVVREYAQTCQKEFILTVPAVWSDKAMDLTAKAAKKAGIHPVTLIKEPEAAALYTLTTNDHSIKAGDSFVLCDAGGGTVDLITYRVKSTQPYPELAELVRGTGGMAGSLGLNKRFEYTVRAVVGDEQFTSLKGSIGWTKALSDFDKIVKTSFTGEVTDSYYISFPMAKLNDNPDAHLWGNSWKMTGKVLRDIFEPIIQDVLGLVETQVKNASSELAGQTVKGICLVGGFGSSSYLRKRLQKVYEPQGIQIIQPHDAWGAIVKGAVLSGVSNWATVVSTKAPRHYGVISWPLFDPLKDDERWARLAADEETKRVQKLEWYIHMGQELKRDDKIRASFFRTFGEGFSDDELVIRPRLHYSEAEEAPTYPGPEVEPWCEIRADLRGIDRSKLRKRTQSNGLV